MNDYLYHLRGYTTDGRRVNRKYKTSSAAHRMTENMHWIDMAYLKVISYSDIDRALNAQAAPEISAPHSDFTDWLRKGE